MNKLFGKKQLPQQRHEKHTEQAWAKEITKIRSLKFLGSMSEVGELTKNEKVIVESRNLKPKQNRLRAVILTMDENLGWVFNDELTYTDPIVVPVEVVPNITFDQ